MASENKNNVSPDSVEITENIGEWFVSVVRHGKTYIKTFEVESFARNYAEGQRLGLELSETKRKAIGSAMGKRQASLDPNSGDFPYDVAFFAEKHGLTLRAAKIILCSNGPSRTMCDAAARAFVAALAARCLRAG